jgi:mono/diheme cytochrome c family protein
MLNRAIALVLGGVVLLFGTSLYGRAPGLAKRAAPVAVTVAAPAQSATPAQAAATTVQPRAVLDKYCVTCHNQRLKTGGLALDTIDVNNAGAHAETLEAVVRKLRGGLMPPPGRPRPDAAMQGAFIASLESSLDRAAAARPDPGRTEPMHRLNRAEYRNAVRDLLDVDIDVSAMLPADDTSYGFDNMAGVQRMSATLLERYLGASQKISSVVVGASAVSPTTQLIRIPPELRQDDRLDGMPFGSRGGTLVNHIFSRDGEYLIRVELARRLDDVPVYNEEQRLELTIDGEPLHVFELAANLPPSRQPDFAANGVRNVAQPQDRRLSDSDWQVRLPIKAGQRELMLTFLNRVPALLENTLEPFEKPVLGGGSYYPTQKGAYLRTIEIAGPYNASGTTDTAARRRVFVCQPATAAEEAPCAKKIISTLARRGFRRPVADADLQMLMTFYQEGRASGSFDAGIERAVQGLLMSPEFLFRVERDPSNVAGTAPYRVSDIELASRLSFFLWSSIPDDQLLDIAAAGKLRDPKVLDQQVRRMLADPKAESLVGNFIGQWLFLRNLAAISPDPKREPDFDEGLRQGFRRETEMFANAIFKEDRSLVDFLTADFTFVNERLAKHYGIPNVQGDHFRRVPVTDQNRRGLLGQGSVLSVTSFPHRTSPVVRGKWILENFLGTPPPPPPPDVPALDEKPNAAEEEVSMRQRIAKHRANPVCASCHGMMDPIGLSLENFDLAGRWRPVDEALMPIDATGVLPDGRQFTGPAGLRQVIADRPEAFVSTVTEKLLTYALGRGLESYDMPAVRKIIREAAKQDYRASTIVLGVINSLPFQMRRPVS